MSKFAVDLWDLASLLDTNTTVGGKDLITYLNETGPHGPRNVVDGTWELMAIKPALEAGTEVVVIDTEIDATYKVFYSDNYYQLEQI